MITYEFKTDEEGIDNRTRTIISTDVVTETRIREFTLEQSENGLEGLLDSKVSVEKQITDKTAEIAEIKNQLDFGDK